MSPRILALATGVAALGLVVTSTGWVTQWQRATAEQERAEALSEEVAALQDRVAALEARTDEDDDVDAGDDERTGALDGLLDGLLGDSGVLGDLVGGGVPGARCITPRDGLDDLFGGTGPALPTDPVELVDVVADQVAELRGLDWQTDPEVDFVDADELADRLASLLAEDADPEALEAQRRLLHALGAIAGDLDLEEVQRRLLDEQVAGYYHPDSGELVVRVPDDGRIRPLDQVTLAHELEHALADQALGLPDLDAESYDDDADASLGALALVEGDATLLMNQWMLQHLSLPEQLSGALGGDLAAAQASLDAVPHHLQRELLYPYTAGLDYVCARWLEGGWEAVDAAYADPPATSYEVLFPDDPREPRTPAPLTPPAGGEQILDSTFGAAPLLWLLEAPGGEPDRALDAPRDRASAWAGGRVAVWDLDGVTVAGLSLVDGDGSLCATVADWHLAAFPDHEPSGGGDTRTFTGDDAAAALSCEGDAVHYATTGDLEVARRVVGR